MSDEQGWTAPGAAPPQRGWAGDDRHEAFRGGDDAPAAPPPPPPGPPPAAPGVAPTAGPAPAYPPPAYVEYRPGIIPLRPLTLSELWSGVMTAIRGNPAATIGLALVTTTVVLIPLTAIGAWLSGTSLLPPLGPLDPTDPTAGDANIFFTGQLSAMVPGLATYVTALLLPLFMAVVVGQGVQGRKVGLGETWRAARGRIPAALGVFFTVAFVAVVGMTILVLVVVIAWQFDADAVPALVTIAAVVVGIAAMMLLSVRWAFATPIVVLENLGPWKAMTRSWQLTRKRGFWRIFGIRLLTVIVATLAASVITTPLSFAGSFIAFGDPGSPNPATWVLPVFEAVGVLIQSVLSTPFVSGVDSLLYVDQRIRHEGLDVQLVQQANAAPAS